MGGMTGERYPKEILGDDSDDGTMPENVARLSECVTGRRIASVESSDDVFTITLDNGKKVILENQVDCCAFTDLQSFLLNPELVDHMITGVGTTDGYAVWHIYADMGDVLRLNVEWSCGNPFYYIYGFRIKVSET